MLRYYRESQEPGFLTMKITYCAGKFSARSLKISGRTVSRIAEAPQRLSYRVQQPEESYTRHIEGILSICKRADPAMPISEQIRHIVKSVHEDVFDVLVVRYPPNMAAVASVCNAVYDARHS